MSSVSSEDANDSTTETTYGSYGTEDSDDESNSSPDTSEDESSTSTDDESEDNMDDDDEDAEEDETDPWEEFIQTVHEHYQEDMDEAVADLMQRDGISKGDAVHEVYENYLPRLNKRLRGLLVKFMCHARELKQDPTYKKIVQTAKRLRDEDDMDYEESVTQAAEARKVLITRTLKQWEPDSSDEDDSESENSENDENYVSYDAIRGTKTASYL